MASKAPTARLIAAVLLAPLLGCAFMGIVFALFAHGFTEIGVHFARYGVIFGLAFGAVMGIPAMLIGGLPLHVFFMRRGFTAFWVYTIAGGCVGVATGIAYTILEFGPSFVLNVSFSLLGIGTGCVCGFLFWLIRRPDRITPNPHTPRS